MQWKSNGLTNFILFLSGWNKEKSGSRKAWSNQAMAKSKKELIAWDKAFPEIIREKGLGSKFVIEYLSEALNDTEPKIIFIALRHLIKASPLTIESIAKKACVCKRTIDRILNLETNASRETINNTLEALGFSIKFSVERNIKKVA